MTDIVLMERVLAAAPERRPQRVVVDAHAAPSMGRVAIAARRAGIPFLVDPQTHFLQDSQHSAHPWAQLPFGSPQPGTPAELLQPGRLDVLVAAVVEHQLSCEATAIIAPYVHLERPGDGWADVQVQLWRATGRYLEQQGVKVRVTAVIALGWRLLDRPTWPGALRPLIAALYEDPRPAEVALAASKVDQGVQPELASPRSSRSFGSCAGGSGRCSPGSRICSARLPPRPVPPAMSAALAAASAAT